MILQELTEVLKPFMAAQLTLEGEKYVTISMVPYMISTIRAGLQNVVNGVRSSECVKTLATIMLNDFNQRWGSGEDGSVFTENQVRGDRQRQKGIPKKTLMAAALDPRTKSLGYIGPTDREAIWTAVINEGCNIIYPAANEQADGVNELADGEVQEPPLRRRRVAEGFNVFAGLGTTELTPSNCLLIACPKWESNPQPFIRLPTRLPIRLTIRLPTVHRHFLNINKI